MLTQIKCFSAKASHVIFIKVENHLPNCINNLVSKHNDESVAKERGSVFEVISYYKDKKLDMLDSEEEAIKFKGTRSATL